MEKENYNYKKFDCFHPVNLMFLLVFVLEYYNIKYYSKGRNERKYKSKK